MKVASRFVPAALGAAMVVLAGCGGGDPEGPEPEAAAFLEDAADDEQAAELRAAMEHGPVAASSCRAGRPCRLAGSIVSKGSGQFTPPGCSTLTTTSFGRAIVNVTFQGTLQRPGRYNARVSMGTYPIDTTVSPMTCQLPGGGSFTVTGWTESHKVPARTFNVIVVSDGRNLTVNGALAGAPPVGCTGGDRFTGADIGLANPMVTLKSTMRCNIAGVAMTVTHTVKLLGAP
jgi:hypothetical protein